MDESLYQNYNGESWLGEYRKNSYGFCVICKKPSRNSQYVLKKNRFIPVGDSCGCCYRVEKIIDETREYYKSKKIIDGWILL